MKPLAFKTCVRQAMIPAFVRLPIGYLLLTYFIYVLKTFRFWDLKAVMELNVQVFNEPRNLRSILLVWFMTFIGMVVYPYFRTRNPTYIKKQEAYEKWKAEKDAAKQKADE